MTHDHVHGLYYRVKGTCWIIAEESAKHNRRIEKLFSTDFAHW